MAEDRPYKVVVEALAAQTVAIGKLAKEIKVEFAQYQAAASADDQAKAQRIADAINSRTDKLVSAAEQLASTTPGAEVGGGPADPSGRPDNDLPEGEGPVDPGFGQGGGGGSTLPGNPAEPVDPGFGGGRPNRPGIDNDLPEGEGPVDPGFGGGRPNRPGVDNDLPESGQPKR